MNRPRVARLCRRWLVVQVDGNRRWPLPDRFWFRASAARRARRMRRTAGGRWIVVERLEIR